MTYEEYKSAVEHRVFNNIRLITGIIKEPVLNVRAHYENAVPVDDMAASITKRMLRMYSYDPCIFRILYPEYYS